MDSPNTAHPQRLIGYVLTATAQGLDNSGQVQPIREFCRKRGHLLVYLEPEAGSSSTLMRPGLWRTIRSLICYKCAAKDMPLNTDTAEWLKRVFEPCRCDDAEGLEGMIVATMGAVSTNQMNGARLTLSLAQIGKHLYLAPQEQCVACCNPAARNLIRDL
jgi:hypothetical protein